jgi:hypothetical protein
MVLHWLQHGASVPYRVYCSVIMDSCQNERYDEATGFSPWVVLWYRIEQWQLSVHPIVQGTVGLLLAIPAIFFIAVGVLLTTPFRTASSWMTLLTCAIGYYMVWKAKGAGGEKLLAGKNK